MQLDIVANKFMDEYNYIITSFSIKFIEDVCDQLIISGLISNYFQRIPGQLQTNLVRSAQIGLHTVTVVGRV